MSSADRDAEVEQLIKIGRYMVDRWTAQQAVRSGYGLEKRLQEALDNCTYGHMRKIQNDADKLLDAYLDRKRPVLDSEVVIEQLEKLRSSIKQDIVAALPARKLHWRPAWVRWLMTELGAGPVAAVGVIIAALMLHFVAPKLEMAAAHQIEEMFGASTASP